MLKMEKMRGAMWIIFVFFLLNAARSQEIADSKCSIEFDGECVKRVSCTVETNVVKEKSELFVSYKNQEQIEEGIADCKWSLETFYCDPSKGYFCELRMPTNFSIFINTTARCVTSGQFIIDAANQQSIKCNVSEYKRNTPDQFNQSVSTTTSGGKYLVTLGDSKNSVK
ncbi:uncharacterized protein LOC112568562 [Pomacea canaliculata]|uniref:uncharacterized protein LOC112568562 n=1 Tax=Pomacea canaliculata TaxID=400727 RepID=UPI000D736C30|nr:uncharacterized protein LOC112568562 [Pomacea canaliculata]